MRSSPAFTLLELLIVITLIGIVSISALTNYIGARRNQALQSSAESLADVLKRAHIFSRENKDLKTWGVKYDTPNSYQLVTYTTNPAVIDIVTTFNLDSEVTFEADFGTDWFEAGTGDNAAVTIFLKNSHGMRYSVNILETGVIEVKPV